MLIDEMPDPTDRTDEETERHFALLIDKDEERLSLISVDVPVTEDVEEFIGTLPDVKSGGKRLWLTIPPGIPEEAIRQYLLGEGAVAELPVSFVEGVYVRENYVVVNGTDEERFVMVSVHDEEPRADGVIHFWTEYWWLAPQGKRRADPGTLIRHVLDGSCSDRHSIALMVLSGEFTPMDEGKLLEILENKAV